MPLGLSSYNQLVHSQVIVVVILTTFFLGMVLHQSDPRATLPQAPLQVILGDSRRTSSIASILQPASLFPLTRVESTSSSGDTQRATMPPDLGPNPTTLHPSNCLDLQKQHGSYAKCLHALEAARHPSGGGTAAAADDALSSLPNQSTEATHTQGAPAPTSSSQAVSSCLSDNEVTVQRRTFDVHDEWAGLESSVTSQYESVCKVHPGPLTPTWRQQTAAVARRRLSYLELFDRSKCPCPVHLHC
jgi:hypothetical protein